MTTAHRPTWKPALGMSNAANKGYIPTRSYSARDLPGYLALKDLKQGQGSAQQLKERDFKAQLLKREAELKDKQLQGISGLKAIAKGNSSLKLDIKESDPDLVVTDKTKIRRPGEKDQIPAVGEGQQPNPFPQDQDSQSFCKQKPDQQSDDDDDDSEDNQVLLREFQKVKQQREREQKKKLEEKAKYSTANRQSQLLKGNPLLGSTYSLSKRWYQDTVFKNQAKRVQQKKNYVNDHVRSEFHRKFMSKYVMR